MASMAPTAGGQYHWISEFAPASCQKFLDFTSSAGWDIGTACLVTQVAALYCNLGSDSIVQVWGESQTPA